MSFEQWLHSGRERNHSALRLRAVPSTLAVDHETVSLPVDVVFGEMRELRYAESGVEECPHDQFFFVRVAERRQAVRFVRAVNGSRLNW